VETQLLVKGWDNDGKPNCRIIQHGVDGSTHSKLTLNIKIGVGSVSESVSKYLQQKLDSDPDTDPIPVLDSLIRR